MPDNVHNRHRDYLAHHGIKGQKWGIRRYQNPNGTLTALGRERYSKSNARNSQEGYVDPILAAYGIYVGVALTAGAIAMGYSKIQTNKAALRIAKSKIDPKTGLPLKSEPMTEDQDMKCVNPGYLSFRSGASNNCGLCTMTYDLRRRGFEVIAGETKTGIPSNAYEKYYKDSKVIPIIPKGSEAVIASLFRNPNQMFYGTKPDGYDEYHAEMKRQIKKELLSQGDGARGHLGVTWFGAAGAHSVAYEIKNGEIIIRDCQVGVTVDLDDMLDDSCFCRYCRFDNKEPNYEEMRKDGVI